MIKGQSLSSVVSQIASCMFYSCYAKSREVGIVHPDQRFVIVIKRAAAAQTGGPDRNKCIVLLKLINVIAFITACEIESTLNGTRLETQMFIPPPHPSSNWFGSEIVHKSVEALRQNLLLIHSSEGFCCAQGLKS